MKRAALQPWVIWLARLGFVVRGIIYMVIGYLALRLALGSGGGATTPAGALDVIAQQPFGKALMWGAVVGLAGYSLWGLVRALFDPMHRGSDAKGLGARFGFLVSGLGYGALVIPALKAAQNQPKGAQSGSNQDIAQRLLDQPYGAFLVAAFGLFWIIAAIDQFRQAYTAKFMRDLKTSKMGPEERVWARRIGRIGLAARGVVYALIGLFMFQAAVAADSLKAQGFDGALLKLAQQPYGAVMLGVVSAGLIVFGLYSIMNARWYDTGEA